MDTLPATDEKAPSEKVVGLSGRIAEFAATLSLDSVPERALANAKIAILDCLGVSVLATSQEIGAALLGFARTNAAPGPCTVWGTGVSASPRDAALLNGTLAHGLDFDDRGHSSTYTLAASLAVAEQHDLSGAAMLEAFIVGKEVRAALDPLFATRESGIGPGARGWHANGILGPIASACAAGHALRFDCSLLSTAIGLAAGSCGALTRDGGTMAKPFRCGHAAAAGLTAALLAQSGFSADDTAIEGAYGLVAALGPIPDTVVAALGGDLGETFHLEADLRGKTFSSCTSSHGGLEAMLRLRAKTPIAPAAVESIECDLKLHRLLRERPTRGYEGRFSMPFCLALALIRGRVDPDDFTDRNAHDPAIRSVMGRTRNTPGAPALVVALKDGTRLVEPLKPPANLSSWDGVAEKFARCVQGVLPAHHADAVVHMVRELDSLASVRPLTALLRTDAR